MLDPPGLLLCVRLDSLADSAVRPADGEPRSEREPPGGPRLAASWTTAITLLAVLAAPSTHAADVLCPAGEITLAGGRLRTNPRHGAPPKLASTGGTFVVPAGVAIDPANEPLVFAIEGDRQPIGSVTLPAGSLLAHAGGKRFMQRVGGSKVTLQRVGGGDRLTGRLGELGVRRLYRVHP